jgi:hypothetical protein
MGWMSHFDWLSAGVSSLGVGWLGCDEEEGREGFGDAADEWIGI